MASCSTLLPFSRVSAFRVPPSPSSPPVSLEWLCSSLPYRLFFTLTVSEATPTNASFVDDEAYRFRSKACTHHWRLGYGEQRGHSNFVASIYLILLYTGRLPCYYRRAKRTICRLLGIKQSRWVGSLCVCMDLHNGVRNELRPSRVDPRRR